ncbi:MAG: nitrite/sulfite reductase [Candidatus Latescibacteria bacterium]|nr:nitrite/sulfite reductase [Candidatus Latescibacterota bacterium]
MSVQSWKEKLDGQLPEELSAEVDTFETQIEQKKSGQIDDRVFAETRLRRGVYGQRYDNGQRFDGQITKRLEYPCGELFKGPDTYWDAPGMQRIKIPFGGLTADQLDVMADLAEEYADDILHITTRQGVQLHFVHIEDTPDLMRRLASVGITTREACGNSIRNVTACPISGVCRTETFDVTPYSKALATFMLGHPDCQDFGRKVKIAFSGCAHEACGLTSMHDLGFIAKTQDGKVGFEFYVGGGLGAVPHQAKLFDDFLPAEEILPMSQAVCRVFARLGEKANRARARVKFLLAKLGLEEFQRLVQEERAILPHDDAWTAYLDDLDSYKEEPLKIAAPLNGAAKPEGYDAWASTNVYKQRQEGYVAVTVSLPLGDITSDQTRALADLSRKYVKDTIRTTVEQNIILRWVSESDLTQLYGELVALGLGEPGAGTIVDVTTCPGTDTCKLGISSSRGLAGELRSQLAAQSMSLDESIKNFRIKISGCFNSCGQHHVADLGFYGNSRRVNGYTVPHFQVVLGGQWTENAGSYGLAMGAVPSKNIPAVIECITGNYVANRQGDESFQDYVKRIGKKEVKNMLTDLTSVPAHEEDASYYVDWGESREFTVGDMGKGECAGEVVTLVEFELSGCETESFEAQLQLDEGNYEAAYKGALSAMLHAAKALIKTQWLDVPDAADEIVKEFRERFCDTELFYNQFAGPKFANYLFRVHEEEISEYTQDVAHRVIEEGQLFIEQAYACYGRMNVVNA